MEVELPEGMDWELWRIYGSPFFSVQNPSDIETQWSLDDVLAAHDFLDLQDALEAAKVQKAIG